MSPPQGNSRVPFTTALISIILFMSPTLANATSFLECLADFAQKTLLDPITKKLESQKLKTDKGKIRLGKFLGAGLKGMVYEIRPRGGGKPTQVIKLPRLSLLTSSRFQYAEDSILLEIKDLETVQAQLGKIEMNEKYPKKPAWKKGSIPMVPIEDVVETEEYGTGLVKPFVKARALKDIPDLTEEQAESLKELYAFTDLVDASIPGFKMDIKTSNIIWIDDPALKLRIGISRNSFILSEMGQANVQIPKRPIP